MIPPNFFKVLKDFVEDLVCTFPELKTKPDIIKIISGENTEGKAEFDLILSSFPPHMVDILNENEEMFTKECIFLPDVDFKQLWNDNITDKTKQVIWKYLKLLLFIVLGHLKLDEGFSSLLKGFDINKTIDDMKTFFDTNDAPDMHSHLEGLMGGKLGALAKEIAKETLGDQNEADAFQNIMSEPKKLFSLVHSVGDKLDKKIKSGDLKESELIEEATEMFEKIKDMPCMKQFESMFGKMNPKATQSKINEHLKKAKMKERLRDKLKMREKTEVPEVKEKDTKEDTSKEKNTSENPKKKNKKKKHVLDS